MDIYPMPFFNKLLVSDIEKSEKWYQQTLGFTSLFKFRNDQQQVLMNHLRLNKYQDIMLIKGDNFTVGNSLYLNLLVDNIETLAKQISPNIIINELREQPWNALEMTIQDPDGYLITLTQPHLAQKEFDKLIAKTKKHY